MKENRLYDINSVELFELIDKAKFNLKCKNTEYKNLKNEFYKIMNNNPKLQAVIEENEIIELDTDNIKMLQELYVLYLQMNKIEEREIFFLGAKENYFYFKNLGIIKEN